MSDEYQRVAEILCRPGEDGCADLRPAAEAIVSQMHDLELGWCAECQEWTEPEAFQYSAPARCRVCRVRHAGFDCGPPLHDHGPDAIAAALRFFAR